MKLVFSLLILVSFSVNASSLIKGVTICGAACNNGFLNTISNTSASYGSIFYSKFTTRNATNTTACLTSAEELSLAGDRNNVETPYGIKEQECASIMMGKYYGKKVDLTVERLSDRTTYVLKIK